MKSLLVGINAKFIHTNLAIRYIAKYGEQRNVPIEIAEYTINQSIDYILDGVLSEGADIIGFSCYLWNIEMIKKLVRMIKQVSPSTLIFLGGPEVSYNTEDWMAESPGIDYIIAGEGEIATIDLLKKLSNQDSINACYNLTYRNTEGNITKNVQGPAMDLADVPFVYEKGLPGLNHKILYYETSRGCPYACQYCLSSIEKGVRFRPLNMVYKELQFFLDEKVTQIKFVDRTFNANKRHTLAIWHYLHENDNGVTNFHFEITADLLDDETINFLRHVRVGLFQFEVGVQSTNEATIVDIDRKTDFDKLKDRVLRVMEGQNIHMHLDLIAGLPKEDYKSFAKSFNDVMAMKPEQLQLGFLKVLKGSQIHVLQKQYGIVYRDFAPYEVLSTKEMSYADLRRLKDIEHLLELYYNSMQFQSSVAYLMALCAHDFAFFEGFTTYWRQNALFDLPHNKLALYDYLYGYGTELTAVDGSYLKDLIKFDLCRLERPKKWPKLINRNEKTSDEERNFYKSEINQETLFSSYKGYNSKQISRMALLEAFDYNPISGENEKTWLFFDYKARDHMTNYATWTLIRKDQLT